MSFSSEGRFKTLTIGGDFGDYVSVTA